MVLNINHRIKLQLVGILNCFSVLSNLRSKLLSFDSIILLEVANQSHENVLWQAQTILQSHCTVGMHWSPTWACRFLSAKFYHAPVDNALP